MPITFGSSQTSNKPASRIGLSIFFAFFFLMGTMFLIFMSHEAWKSISERKWESVPCKILSSEIAEKPSQENPFVFQVKYQYKHNSHQFTSTTYKRNYNGDKNYSEATSLCRRYASGSVAQAYVNPQKPSEAVLEHTTPWILAFVIIPLIFMAVGAGGIYFTLTDKSDRILSSKKSTTTVVPKGGSYIGIVIFFLFTMIGGYFVLTWSLPKFEEALDSQNWKPTPCNIISSRIDSHHDSDNGTTYSINILYSYTFNGMEYKSNCYDLMGGSSSGYKSKKKIIQKYPPGHTATCFVNSSSPFHAALQTGLTGIHFVLIIPAIFMLIGVIGLVSVIYKKFISEEKIENPQTLSSTPSPQSLSSVVLKEKISPMVKFVGTLIGSIILGGIVVLLIRYALQEKEWVLIIFCFVFGAVEAALIGVTFWSFLALFNPRLQVTANAQRLTLGSILEVNWKFLGDVQRMNRLQIHLKGREEATYTQGTRTSTDKNVFAQMLLLDTAVKWDIAAGQCSLEIPPDTMHSLNAKNNKIIWSLNFSAEITSWPDVDEEYPIEILPKETV